MTVLLRLLGSPIFAYALMGVTLLGGWQLVKHRYYTEGYNAALQHVAEENAAAIQRVNEARDRIRQCADSGGVWNTATGVCEAGGVRDTP